MPDGGPSTLPIPSVDCPRNIMFLDDPPSSADEDLSEDEGPTGPSPKKARLEEDIDKVPIETKEFEWSDERSWKGNHVHRPISPCSGDRI